MLTRVVMGSSTPARPHVALQLSGENWRHIETLGAEMRRVYAIALNEELRFLRTWNLAPSQLRALAADAGRRGLTSWRHFKTLIKRFAMGLPDSGRPPPPAPALLPPHRTSFHLLRVNHDWVLSISEEESLSFPAALNHILDFGRTYSLAPDLLAVLTDAAAAQGVSPRALLQVHLWRTAGELIHHQKVSKAK